jgi:chromosome segregation ATPase
VSGAGPWARLLRSIARVVRRLLGTGQGPAEVPAEVTERFDRQHGRIAELERDLARIGPQVAALEARFEDLRQQQTVPRPGAEELDEAGVLVEQVRREHERMRARVSAAARFEERLGQLEDQMTALNARTAAEGRTDDLEERTA